MKRLIAGLAGAAVLASPVAGAAPSKTGGEHVFPRGLPFAYAEGECAGVARCVWDARHQGNGTGHSLILTRYRGEYLAARITHRRAHHLQALWCQRQNVTCEGYAD